MDYTIEHYETKKEILREIVISNNKTYYPKTLYEVQVSDLNKDDIINITSAYEVTNNYKFNVMIASSVTLGSIGSTTLPFTIDEGRGYNVTPAMHHGCSYHVRQFKISKDMPGENVVSTVLWSASDAASPSLNDKLKIEQGYGHLDVLIYRSQ